MWMLLMMVVTIIVATVCDENGDITMFLVSETVA